MKLYTIYLWQKRHKVQKSSWQVQKKSCQSSWHWCDHSQRHYKAKEKYCKWWNLIVIINKINRQKHIWMTSFVWCWIIQNWHVQEKKAPTLKRVHGRFHEDMTYTGGREGLHPTRFRRHKTKTNRRPLMGHHEFQN